MKRMILKGIMLVMVILMIASLSLVGCKDGATESVAEETVEEAEATEEVTEESEEAAEVVAEEEELYIWSCGVWGLEVMIPYIWGGYTAAQELGVKFEHVGPEDWDTDKILAGLEAAIAKNPTGILWVTLGIGEEQLLTDYYNSGGMIAGMNGTNPGTYPQTLTVGTDNVYYGEEQARFVVDSLGEELKVAIMTLPEADNHIKRIAGVNSVFDKYDGIEVVGIVDQTSDQAGAAANASAFLAANPDIDAFVCTSALGGAAVGRAIKEAGLDPGSIFVIAGDMDQELLDLIDEGYVSASLAQSFAVETYYAILAMHTLKNSSVQVSNDDEAAGFLPTAANIITALPFITKDNLEYFQGLEPPEGF